VAYNSGDNEWHTPAKHIEMARTVLGTIDLDPASNEIAQQTVRTERYFTAETDGLQQQWRGPVWLNPPYSSALIGLFVRKLIEERCADNITAIMLVNNSTDTAWWHEAEEIADAICFTRGRIQFIDPNGVEVGSPTQGQCFFYYGDDKDKFADVFKDIGCIR
jgi:ParB family chromosome partitioning protein